MNLWLETINVLTENGKTWEEVIAVQATDIRISKEKFQQIAKRTRYYAGYGGARDCQGSDPYRV